MDIRVLRYFLAAAREENITRAAESLHISQPSLSKQLMDLEQETGKQLLVRGKRKITLTEDGVLLRKRADEIIKLLEKTERELSADCSQVSGEIAIGGNPTTSILKAAFALRTVNPEVQFQFYSSDATDVAERLEHGSLDLAIFLEPIDNVKFEYISLPDVGRWGLLMPCGCELAKKSFVTSSDILSVPLIFHRRAGLQRIISRWAETDIENFSIAATYNVASGSPERFVKNGFGYYLTIDDQLPERLGDNVCFRPLYPELSASYALVWKRTAVLSRVSRAFLDTIRQTLDSYQKQP